MGRHSVEDERVFWRSFGLTLIKWVAVAVLPVLAAFGIWRLVAGSDADPSSEIAAPTPSVSPTNTAPASPTPSPSPSPSPSATATATPKAQVQVLNATGKPGTGTSAAQRLEEAGYEIVATQNASRRYARTTVFYQPGYKQAAEEVAKVLGVGLVQPAIENLDKKIPVSAVIGDDYKP